MVKRKLPPHIVLRNGQWRFVKRSRTGVKLYARKKRRKVIMARRRRSFGRRVSRARSWGGGKNSVTKNAIDGVIVGVAQTALPDVIPMQDSLIALGVGWFRKNPTLVTIGGIQLGAQLGGMVGGALGSSKVSGVTSQV